MVVAVILVGVVTVLAVALVAWPLLRNVPEPASEDPRSDERRRLDDEIERSLAAIREIEFDRRAGNLSEEDFAALDAQERARAVDLLRRRDELGDGA
jgi:hypothetical protein